MDEIEMKMRRIEFWEDNGVMPEPEMIELDFRVKDELLMEQREFFGMRYGDVPEIPGYMR